MIDWLLYALNHGLSALLILALFGVTVAALVGKRETMMVAASDTSSSPQLPPPPDPFMCIWWKKHNLPAYDWEYEIVLINGETWRGRHVWRRYPDGMHYTSAPNWQGMRDRLQSYVQQIEWSTDEAKAKHFDAYQERAAAATNALAAQAVAYAAASPQAHERVQFLARQMRGVQHCSTCGFALNGLDRCLCTNPKR